MSLNKIVYEDTELVTAKSLNKSVNNLSDNRTSTRDSLYTYTATINNSNAFLVEKILFLTDLSSYENSVKTPVNSFKIGSIMVKWKLLNSTFTYTDQELNVIEKDTGISETQYTTFNNSLDWDSTKDIISKGKVKLTITPAATLTPEHDTVFNREYLQRSNQVSTISTSTNLSLTEGTDLNLTINDQLIDISNISNTELVNALNPSLTNSVLSDTLTALKDSSVDYSWIQFLTIYNQLGELVSPQTLCRLVTSDNSSQSVIALPSQSTTGETIAGLLNNNHIYKSDIVQTLNDPSKDTVLSTEALGNILNDIINDTSKVVQNMNDPRMDTTLSTQGTSNYIVQKGEFGIGGLGKRTPSPNTYIDNIDDDYATGIYTLSQTQVPEEINSGGSYCTLSHTVNVDITGMQGTMDNVITQTLITTNKEDKSLMWLRTAHLDGRSISWREWEIINTGGGDIVQNMEDPEENTTLSTQGTSNYIVQKGEFGIGGDAKKVGTTVYVDNINLNYGTGVYSLDGTQVPASINPSGNSCVLTHCRNLDNVNVTSMNAATQTLVADNTTGVPFSEDNTKIYFRNGYTVNSILYWREWQELSKGTGTNTLGNPSMLYMSGFHLYSTTSNAGYWGIRDLSIKRWSNGYTEISGVTEVTGSKATWTKLPFGFQEVQSVSCGNTLVYAYNTEGDSTNMWYVADARGVISSAKNKTPVRVWLLRVTVDYGYAAHFNISGFVTDEDFVTEREPTNTQIRNQNNKKILISDVVNGKLVFVNKGVYKRKESAPSSSYFTNNRLYSITSLTAEETPDPTIWEPYAPL